MLVFNLLALGFQPWIRYFTTQLQGLYLFYKGLIFCMFRYYTA